MEKENLGCAHPLCTFAKHQAIKIVFILVMDIDIFFIVTQARGRQLKDGVAEAISQ